MAPESLFVVFGATGAQGGSVIDALLTSQPLSSRYRIRGVCRDTRKPVADQLRGKGVEVVSVSNDPRWRMRNDLGHGEQSLMRSRIQADLSSKNDVERALMGADTVFLATAYSGNDCCRDTEIEQGKNVAKVAKVIGHRCYTFNLQFIVVTTRRQVAYIQALDFSITTKHANAFETKLTDFKFLVSGQKIHHANEFESKAIIEQFIRQLGIPSTFVIPGFYMDLFIPGHFLDSSGDNNLELELRLPIAVDSSKIPLIDIRRDFGRFVTTSVLNKQLFLGKRLYAAQGYYTPVEIRDTINRFNSIHGMICHTKEISDNEFLRLDPHSGVRTGDRQKEILSMWHFVRDFGYYANNSIETSQELFGDLSGFDDFVRNSSFFKER